MFSKMKCVFIFTMCVLAYVIWTVITTNHKFLPLTKVSETQVKETHKKKVEKVYIPDNYRSVACNYTLNIPHEKIIEKVASYEFPDAQNYMKDLFTVTDRRELSENPVFVTAISSNHYEEGLAMIYNFNKVLNKNKTIGLYKLVVYDLGLTNEEIDQVKIECACQVRKFPFDKFPDHIRKLRGCLWKPLVIQLVANEHRLVVWMDASIRFFEKTNIEELLQRTKANGAMALRGLASIAYQTWIETFRFLNEPPCLYIRKPESAGTFVTIYQTPFIAKYFMIPWVSCALSIGCMEPTQNADKLIVCRGRLQYFGCHRFDQSVLGILMNRLFNKEIHKHYIIDGKYNYVCRDCKEKETRLT